MISAAFSIVNMLQGIRIFPVKLLAKSRAQARPMAARPSVQSTEHNEPSAHAPWRELPYQTVSNAAAITGRSRAHIYALLKAGDLHAVTLGNKTLVTTESIVAYLGRAHPWRANVRRVAAANEKRAEIAEK